MGFAESPETRDILGTGQPLRTHQPPVSYSLKECFTPTQGYSAFSEAPQEPLAHKAAGRC